MMPLCLLADPYHSTPCATLPYWRARRASSLPWGAVIVLTGLLVLAGICFPVRPASAQAQLDCPLPAGVTPPAAPPVTAQQVEDGSASLTDFALAVRDIFVNEPGITTLKQLAYVGCLFRQEGGAVAFRFHLRRETGAQRQGVHSREGHVLVRPATQPRDL